MARLLTVHEFVDSCNQKCITQKDRCVRYHTVKDYLVNMETRFEHRKDVLACEGTESKTIRL